MRDSSPRAVLRPGWPSPSQVAVPLSDVHHGYSWASLPYLPTTQALFRFSLRSPSPPSPPPFSAASPLATVPLPVPPSPSRPMPRPRLSVPCPPSLLPTPVQFSPALSPPPRLFLPFSSNQFAVSPLAREPPPTRAQGYPVMSSPPSARPPAYRPPLRRPAPLRPPSGGHALRGDPVSVQSRPDPVLPTIRHGAPQHLRVPAKYRPRSRQISPPGMNTHYNHPYLP